MSEDRNKSFEWFLTNYDELSRQFAPSYLVIKNCAVVEHAATPSEALEKALQFAEIGEFIIQACDGTPDAYTSYISSTCFL